MREQWKMEAMVIKGCVCSQLSCRICAMITWPPGMNSVEPVHVGSLEVRWNRTTSHYRTGDKTESWQAGNSGVRALTLIWSNQVTWLVWTHCLSYKMWIKYPSCHASLRWKWDEKYKTHCRQCQINVCWVDKWLQEWTPVLFYYSLPGPRTEHVL